MRDGETRGGALPPARFSEPERRHLLRWPRIGPRVVDRLEELGIGSIADLRRVGVAHVLRAGRGSPQCSGLINRGDALQSAVAAWPDPPRCRA